MKELLRSNLGFKLAESWMIKYSALLLFFVKKTQRSKNIPTNHGLNDK